MATMCLLHQYVLELGTLTPSQYKDNISWCRNSPYKRCSSASMNILAYNCIYWVPLLGKMMAFFQAIQQLLQNLWWYKYNDITYKIGDSRGQSILLGYASLLPTYHDRSKTNHCATNVERWRKQNVNSNRSGIVQNQSPFFSNSLILWFYGCNYPLAICKWHLSPEILSIYKAIDITYLTDHRSTLVQVMVCCYQAKSIARIYNGIDNLCHVTSLDQR